jgi:hypothetical protein
MNDVAGKHHDPAQARLIELRLAKEKREAALKEAESKQELLELEMEEKYCAKGWVRGVDFEILNTAKGLFAVRKPDFTVAKKYNSIPASKQTDEDIWAFVVPHILEPAGDIARAVMAEHGGLAHRMAIALHNMYGANGPEGRSGKF